MNPPKTPAEFDYDLWTTEDGKCMVRVKATGEVTEVCRNVMRILRTEEKKIRRDNAAKVTNKVNGKKTQLLSLDALPCNAESSAWLEDKRNYAEEVITAVMEEVLRDNLTAKQLDTYIACILKGISYTEYAKGKGTSYQNVQQAICLIRKKAEKLFSES